MDHNHHEEEPPPPLEFCLPPLSEFDLFRDDNEEDSISRTAVPPPTQTEFHPLQTITTACVAACPVCSDSNASGGARSKRRRFEYTESFDVPAKDVPSKLQQLATKHKFGNMAGNGAKISDFYEVLGLKKECTETELKNAYKKLALVEMAPWFLNLRISCAAVEMTP
ncbi:hypothetical protein L1887_20502 [Cichorium endivia]|nr:hypothetical protein L1887_20502 [Cichorium endivia]